MSASLDTICPIPDDLLPPAATDPQARVEWRTPEEIINQMPLADQLAHYKLAWQVMCLELEQARIEIEQLQRAQEAKP